MKVQILKWGRRSLLTVVVAVVALLILAVVADIALDGPIRRSTEGQMNAALVGYSVRVGKANFHVFGFSITYADIVVRQDAHPDPPVAELPRLSASVQWRALFSARLVADFVLDQPTIHVNLPQLAEEANDEVPVSRRGWQEAIQAIYPLKINEVRVNDGRLVYQDEGDFKPLELSRIFVVARNIRNIKSKDREYPSDLHVEGRVFDTGALRVDGHADFLAKPHAGVMVDVKLADMDLSYFEPVVKHYSLLLRQGTLNVDGLVEYAPTIERVDLRSITIHNALVDYVHTVATDVPERKVVTKISRAAQAVANQPEVFLKIDTLKVIDSTIGYIDKTATPNYRIFASNANLELTNLSNQSREGIARAVLRGKFMGSGPILAEAKFRPETNGPNFDLNLEIRDTDMTKMNDLLRAYGNFDVVRGTFAFFTQVSVKNGQMNGYVKPLFKDLNVYDAKQDRHKNIFRKIYEGLVGGVAKVLENRKRGEVATVTQISGPVGNTRTSTLEIIGGLIQNAFFKAILPGFESHVKLPGTRVKHEKGKLAKR